MVVASPTEFGAEIRRVRRALRLTQPELAGLAGCGVALIIQLERGKPDVQLDQILAVLDALDLQVSLEPRLWSQRKL